MFVLSNTRKILIAQGMKLLADYSLEEALLGCWLLVGNRTPILTLDFCTGFSGVSVPFI